MKMSSLTSDPQLLEMPLDCSAPAPTAATLAPSLTSEINGYLIVLPISTALALVTAIECGSVTHIPSLIYGAVLWGWWASIAASAWKLAERFPPLSNLSFRTISIHLSMASLLGVAHLFLLWGVGFVSAGWAYSKIAPMMWTYLFNWNRFGIEILLYGFVFGIVGVLQYRMRAQKDAMHALELQQKLSAAHLRALQMQLEPHFLFNTLNAITTLVELGRQKQAAEMLRHLNAILKSTLQRNTPEKVPLSQELEILESYLAIEQVRFADRLRLDIRVDPAALDGLVPCFLLQPIVENAIRHGIAHCENDGVLEASAVRDGSSLRLLVRDTGPGAGKVLPSGSGIGLRNTRERLAHFYRNNFLMNAAPLATGGFEVAITIPYESRPR
jgi:signal transduction histidine kinase